MGLTQQEVADHLHVSRQILLLTVFFSFVMSRIPELANQRILPMLVVGIVFLFTILRFFLIIPKDDKVSGKYAPIIIPKSFGVGWAINPYHPLGLALLIGILVAIELMIFFG